MLERRICPQCAKTIAARGPFCKYCGATLTPLPKASAYPPVEQEALEPATPRCPRCRADLPASARFCRRCGTHVTAAPVPRPVAAVSSAPAASPFMPVQYQQVEAPMVGDATDQLGYAPRFDHSARTELTLSGAFLGFGGALVLFGCLLPLLWNVAANTAIIPTLVGMAPALLLLPIAAVLCVALGILAQFAAPRARIVLGGVAAVLAGAQGVCCLLLALVSAQGAVLFRGLFPLASKANLPAPGVALLVLLIGAALSLIGAVGVLMEVSRVWSKHVIAYPAGR